jgi:hypothetical protein
LASATFSRGSRYPGPGCPYCGQALSHAGLRSGPQLCGYCRRGFEAVRFDPPEHTARVLGLAEAGPAGATACASHHNNAAEANCGRCGVFMCGLCRIDADGLVLCPACFDRLSAEGALPSVVVRYRDYGRLASSLSVLGLLLAFAGIVAGPAAVYYGLKGLKQKRQMGESGGRFGIWLAMVLGALEGVGWLALLVLTLRGR